MVAFLTLFLIACQPVSTNQPVSNSYCGDGSCNSNEDCNSCTLDCGECPKSYKEFIVNAYADKSNVRFYEVIPLAIPNYEKSITLTKDNLNNEVYRGNWLALYADYDTEQIRCEVKEYYDGKLNNQFTLDFIQIKKGITGQSISIGYEENIKPNQARYDYTCRGIESAKQFSGSYIVNLEYD